MKSPSYVTFGQLAKRVNVGLCVALAGLFLIPLSSDRANAQPTGREWGASSTFFPIDRNGERVEAAGAIPSPEPKAEELLSLLVANHRIAAPAGLSVIGGYPFSEGRAAIEVGDPKAPIRGFVDETGAWIVKPQFRLAHSFSEGLAAVLFPGTSSALAVNEISGVPYTLSGDLWGYIDKEGNIAIKPAFMTAAPFVCGLAPPTGVDQKTGIMRTGLIDRTGAFVVWSPDWLSIKECTDGLIPISQEKGWWWWKREKWGYIDPTGEMRIGPHFDDAMPFSEGLAAVMKQDKWGYIDRDGRLVIGFRYRTACSFHQGFAMV
jgi:hypothetical protein